jgi:predicted O-linked N-acetylglucosamine transferase (SPINDLY family)
MKNQSKARRLRESVERLRGQGHRIEALRALDEIIGLGVANAQDWFWTGRLLYELGEYAQAAPAFEHCLQRDSSCHDARFDLGRALFELGESDRAAELIDRAADDTQGANIGKGLAAIAPGIPSLDHAAVKRIRQRFAQNVRAAEAPEAGAPRARPADRSRPRVGYLSAHWHQPNYMKPVWPMIRAHDTESFEFWLFDDSRPHSPDETAWQWLDSTAMHRLSVAGLSNREVAQQIRQQQIDILVDLSAYSKPDRLGVYVHRPAPIQMAWFNMYATSGFEEIDYLVGDPWVVHDEEQPHYCERLLKLPVSYLTFQTNHPAPEIEYPDPSPDRPFTFGCLGTMYKMTPIVLEAWAQILKRATDARLALANRDLGSPCNREHLLKRFQEHGVEPQRIEFWPPAKHFQFLQYYARIDVSLDTFPYNGGTTTMEALWQGVPVLTFHGDRWAARTSRTLIANSPVPQFDARDIQEYIQMAVAYATHPDKQQELRAVRGSMRERLVRSPVCDSPRLAREMEALYRWAVCQSVD